MFERDLKERFTHQRELTYDVQQLFQWVDHLVSFQRFLLLLTICDVYSSHLDFLSVLCFA